MNVTETSAEIHLAEALRGGRLHSASLGTG
jgi:hypothetical protein